MDNNVLSKPEDKIVVADAFKPVINVDEIQQAENIYLREENYTEDEISELRKELKGDEEGIKKINVVNSFNPANAQMTETPIHDDSKTITDLVTTDEENLDDPDVKGHFSLAGINDLKIILKDEYSDELVADITNRFDEIERGTDLDELLANQELVNVTLGEQIIKSLKKFKRTIDTIEEISCHLFEKLYTSFEYDRKVINDIKEMRDMNKAMKSKISSVENGSMDELSDLMSTIKSTLSLVEQRERLMKLEKYGMNDAEVLFISEINDIFEDSVKFTKIRNTVSDMNNNDKFAMDINKKEKLVNGSIHNWISDLHSDDSVMYVIPGYVGVAETRGILVDGMKEMLETIMINHSLKEYVVENDDTETVIEFYERKGYLNQELKSSVSRKVLAFMYILTRTFKLKKLRDKNDRRYLSYTMDILAKSNDRRFNQSVIDIIEHVASQLAIK